MRSPSTSGSQIDYAGVGRPGWGIDVDTDLALAVLAAAS